MTLPKLYVIADAETLARRDMALTVFAQQLHRAGVTLVQFRDKQPLSHSLIVDTAILREEMPNATIILNDMDDEVNIFKADGLHLGQTDTHIAKVRPRVSPETIIGLSTHSPDQVERANQTTADYLAIGPVFATSTKPDAAPSCRSRRRPPRPCADDETIGRHRRHQPPKLPQRPSTLAPIPSPSSPLFSHQTRR